MRTNNTNKETMENTAFDFVNILRMDKIRWYRLFPFLPLAVEHV